MASISLITLVTGKSHEKKVKYLAVLLLYFTKQDSGEFSKHAVATCERIFKFLLIYFAEHDKSTVLNILSRIVDVRRRAVLKTYCTGKFVAESH